MFDLVASGGGGLQNYLNVFAQTSPGRFPQSPSRALQAGGFSGFEAADLNIDGQVDLISVGDGVLLFFGN